MKQIDENKLVISRVFQVDQEQLFEAWSDPAIMEKWLFPFGEGGYAEVENEFTRGGDYTLDMYEPDGTSHQMTGEYREIDQYDKIVFTWNSGDLRETAVTLNFSPVEQGTELTLTHEFAPFKDAIDSLVGGWEGCLNSLEKQLSVTAS